MRRRPFEELVDKVPAVAVGFGLVAIVPTRDQQAKAAIGEDGRGERGNAGHDLAVVSVVDTEGGAGEGRATKFQGTQGLDVDGAGKAAFLLICGGRLGNFQRAHEIGRQPAEIEAAVDRPASAAALQVEQRRGQRATVQLHAGECSRQAADAGLRAIAAGAGDLHTSDPLACIGNVLGRELADILGSDDVDHLGRFALLRGGRFEAGTNAFDDDYVAFILATGARILSHRGRVADRDCCDSGEQADLRPEFETFICIPPNSIVCACRAPAFCAPLWADSRSSVCEVVLALIMFSVWPPGRGHDH